MKWLVIIVIVLVLGAALWLRSVRRVGATAPQRAHRLDDSLSVSDAPGPRTEPAGEETGGSPSSADGPPSST